MEFCFEQQQTVLSLTDMSKDNFVVYWSQEVGTKFGLDSSKILAVYDRISDVHNTEGKTRVPPCLREWSQVGQFPHKFDRLGDNDGCYCHYHHHQLIQPNSTQQRGNELAKIKIMHQRWLQYATIDELIS
mmetsp:Transcript_28850/g.31012  ORF Transcript_28850/g.31012 Transcript_28850/m.31012 type:complete len:130 (+) Transcript_28850:704-1093(+)